MRSFALKIWNEKGKSCLHVSSGLCCIKMQGQIKDYNFILNSIRWTNYRSWFYFCEVICESQNLYCLSTSIFWLNGQVIVLRKSIPHPIWKAGIIQNFLNIPMINLKVPEPRHEVQWFWNNIFKTIVKCRIWKKNTIKQLKAYKKSLLRMRNIPRWEMDIQISSVLFSNHCFEKTSDNVSDSPDSKSGTECLNIFEGLKYQNSKLWYYIEI